jgi:hypothetical protein
MVAVRFDKRGGTYGVTFGYDAELVELLKLSVPPYARSWSPPRREWIIEAVYAREFAGTLRQLGHTTIGLETRDRSCNGWANHLFQAVGPDRAPAVHRALTKVLHPDNQETGSTRLQRELNDARAELEAAS